MINIENNNENHGSDNDRAIAVARTNSDLSHSNALRLAMIRIRLFDPESQPMPGTPYRLTLGGQRWESAAQPEAWIEQHVQACPAECLVEWGAGEQPGTYLYETTVNLDFGVEDTPLSLQLRLQNLGYPREIDSEINIAHFRHDYGLSDTEDHTAILKNWHDAPETVKPRVKSQLPDDEPSAPPSAGAAPVSSAPSLTAMAKQALNGLTESLSNPVKSLNIGFGG